MITITVEIDKNCEMAKVNDGVGNGMEGNFWDFHNGCYGLYNFEKFNSVKEFAYILKKYHESKGKNVEIINSKYKYI